MTSSGVAWVWMTEVAVAGDELRRGHPRRSPGIADFGDELQRGVRHGRRRTWPRRRARCRERRRRTWLPAMWSPDCRLELQHRRPPSTAPPLTPTSGSIRVAGRCALRRCPNSVAGPLRSAPSSPAVDPAASPGLHSIHLLLRGSKETRWGEKNLLTWYHLIPLKYYLICGRIAWIPGRYQDLIHRKHHSQRGKNRMIPDRYHPIPRKYHLICGRNARSCDPPRISFVKPDDTRHDTNEDHDTSQISDDSYHVSGDTREVSCDSYHVSCDFYDVSGMILMRSWASRCRGIVAGGRVLPRRCSTLDPNLVTDNRILPRPWYRSSSPATASSVGSSSPAAVSVVHTSIRGCVLHAGAGAATTTTQDPPPSTPHAGARRRRRLCHHAGFSAVHATMPHVGARRRPRPPRWSSSQAAASSTPELGGGRRVCATGVSLVCAAPMGACALASEGGGLGAIPLGQYPNGIPFYFDQSKKD
uniref:Uncharacterized protein n=1 Tax=Oryza rufipogon TaxID=4529 RepID=A0A0E0R594_ORYRU